MVLIDVLGNISATAWIDLSLEEANTGCRKRHLLKRTYLAVFITLNIVEVFKTVIDRKKCDSRI